MTSSHLKNFEASIYLPKMCYKDYFTLEITLFQQKISFYSKWNTWRVTRNIWKSSCNNLKGNLLHIQNWKTSHKLGKNLTQTKKEQDLNFVADHRNNRIGKILTKDTLYVKKISWNFENVTIVFLNFNLDVHEELILK